MQSEECGMVSRWLATLVLIQTLVGTSAAFSEPATPPATGPARAKPAATKPAPSSSMPAQRVRMAIASFLEGSQQFRKHDDDAAPKLTKAIIAGPAEYKGLFSNKPPVTVYCVQVDLLMTNPHLWATHDYLTAVVTFPPGENGKQPIHGVFRSVRTLEPSGKCAGQAAYAPFPELEQLRARRRHALGKPD